jgi:hypothetical protein
LVKAYTRLAILKSSVVSDVRFIHVQFKLTALPLYFRFKTFELEDVSTTDSTAAIYDDGTYYYIYIDELMLNKSYTFRAKCVDWFGNSSAWSTTAAVTTETVTFPTLSVVSAQAVPVFRGPLGLFTMYRLRVQCTVTDPIDYQYANRFEVSVSRDSLGIWVPHIVTYDLPEASGTQTIYLDVPCPWIYRSYKYGEDTYLNVKLRMWCNGKASVDRATWLAIDPGDAGSTDVEFADVDANTHVEPAPQPSASQVFGRWINVTADASGDWDGYDFDFAKFTVHARIYDAGVTWTPDAASIVSIDRIGWIGPNDISRGINIHVPILVCDAAATVGGAISRTWVPWNEFDTIEIKLVPWYNDRVSGSDYIKATAYEALKGLGVLVTAPSGWNTQSDHFVTLFDNWPRPAGTSITLAGTSSIEALSGADIILQSEDVLGTLDQAELLFRTSGSTDFASIFGREESPKALCLYPTDNDAININLGYDDGTTRRGFKKIEAHALQRINMGIRTSAGTGFQQSLQMVDTSDYVELKNHDSALTNATDSLLLTTSGGNVLVTADDDLKLYPVNGNTRIGSASDYTKIEPGGTVEFVGNATVWDDLRVASTSTKLAGSKDPGFAKFKDNGAGSQGVFVYWFDKASEEEVYFTVQFPHSWAGTAVTPHVHWVPKTADAGGTLTVEWGLEYTWANIDGTYGDTSIVYAKSAASHTTAGKHEVTDFSAITPGSGTQDGISSMMICRLFRNATDATDDTYDDDAGLLEFDVHYEINTVGSRTITSK